MPADFEFLAGGTSKKCNGAGSGCKDKNGQISNAVSVSAGFFARESAIVAQRRTG